VNNNINNNINNNNINSNDLSLELYYHCWNGYNIIVGTVIVSLLELSKFIKS
jgi:hypothetical protein